MDTPSQLDRATGYLTTATALLDPATGHEIIVCASGDAPLIDIITRTWPKAEFDPSRFRRVLVAGSDQLQPLSLS